MEEIMQITSLKYTSAVQSLLLIKYYNKKKIKVTSSVVAAAIGVDATVLRNDTHIFKQPWIHFCQTRSRRYKGSY